MAQTLVRILVHLIFSTKDRCDLIRSEVETELYRYPRRHRQQPRFAVLGRQRSQRPHAHAAFPIEDPGVAEVAAEIKKGSSKWTKTKGAACRRFYWQDGYTAFSVSPRRPRKWNATSRSRKNTIAE